MTTNQTPYQSGKSSLRWGRFSQTGQIYHITTATAQRRPLFQTFHNGRFIVDALRREETMNHAQTLAFVVMPDHFHWLMVLNEARDLSTTVAIVKSLSAKSLNQQMHRSGPVWQAGFYDRAIRRNEDLADVARYIVANPLRARLVRSIRDYPLWDAIWV
jgi:putative transposase